MKTSFKHKHCRLQSLTHTQLFYMWHPNCSKARASLGRIYIWHGCRVLVPVRSDGLMGSGGDTWPSCGFWRHDISGACPCDGQAVEVLQRLSHLPWADVVNRMSWSLKHNRIRKRDMELVITILRWNNLKKLAFTSRKSKNPATNSSSNRSGAVKPWGIGCLCARCRVRVKKTRFLHGCNETSWSLPSYAASASNKRRK